MTREHFEADQQKFRDAAATIAQGKERSVQRGGIGWAVEQLQAGKRMRRAGWNGKGMWLDLVKPQPNNNVRLNMTVPYVCMSTAQGDLVPWLCSQTDLLATDWEEVPEGE